MIYRLLQSEFQASCCHTNSAVIPSPGETLRPHSGNILLIQHLLQLQLEKKTHPHFHKWQSLVLCLFLDTHYLEIHVNRPQQYEHRRGQESLRTVMGGDAGTELRGKPETFLRSLLLSLVGVYASGNEMQRLSEWRVMGVYVGLRGHR